ncbi:MAG: DUF7715 family protein, partial [Trebonia sp.]
MLTIHNYPAAVVGDFCWGVEGEVAIAVLPMCHKPDCGCDRAHVGLNSRKASTTVMVRELDLTIDDLVSACLGYLESTWAASCS